MRVSDPQTITPDSAQRELIATVVLLALALLLQLPLILNPGYFSHDELSWAARAATADVASLLWVAWSDVDPFQYRPLTFNLWLLLAHALHAQPLLFHGLWVVLGTLIAFGLRGILIRGGTGQRAASVAALLFLLNPYAVYVHGWVATLADLIWVGCAVLLARWLLASERNSAPVWRLVVAAALAGIVALLAKESALVLAPLAWLAWLLGGRQRIWLWSALGLSVPTLLYLALRIEIILFAPRAGDTYDWSILSMPRAWLHYQLYPFLPTLTEVEAVLRASPARLAMATVLAVGVVIAVVRAGWRAGVGLLVGGALALGPVLLLPTPYTQYGYGWSVLAVAMIAIGWQRTGRPGRIVIGIAALMSTWHGYNVQRDMHHAGQLQSVFSANLRDHARRHDGATLRLAPAQASDAWIYRRLSHDPLAYGTSISPAAVIVDPGQPADLAIGIDGRVVERAPAP